MQVRVVGDSTFTEVDADVVRKIWEGPRGQDGKFLWYGLARGTDLSALAGTGGSPLTGRPFSIPLEWCQYFLHQDPKWDWTTMDWDRDVEYTNARVGFVNALDHDLGRAQREVAFEARQASLQQSVRSRRAHVPATAARRLPLDSNAASWTKPC